MPDLRMSHQILGPLAAFTTSITWAVGSLYYSRLSSRLPEYLINTWRATLGFSAFFIILFLQIKGFGSLASTFFDTPISIYYWVLVSLMASYAFADVMFLFSAKKLGISSSLAIASTYPLWSALAGFFFKNEKLSFIAGMGLVLVVVGTITIILAASPTSKNPASITETNKKRIIVGVSLAVFTSLLWALNNFALAQTSLATEVDPKVVNVIRMGMALILCPAIGMLILKQPRPKFADVKILSRYLPVFMFEGILGSYFYIFSVHNTSLAISSALSSLSPVVVLPLAVVLGYEKFSIKKYLGLLATVIGSCLLLIF